MRKLIMLVEDEPDLVELYKTKLATRYDVFHASNGQEAVNEIKNRSAGRHPDLILMDMMMPGKDGLTSTKEIRGLGFSAPIIMLTNMGDKNKAAEAKNLGADDYVIKADVTPREVLEMVISKIS